jgi:hypothetical protein
MEQINKNDSISYLKKSFLNKKLSRSSFGNSQSTSRSSFDGINSRDYLSMFFYIFICCNSNYI